MIFFVSLNPFTSFNNKLNLFLGMFAVLSFVLSCRHEFYQKSDEVVLTIFAKGIPADKIVIDFGEQIVCIQNPLVLSSCYQFQGPYSDFGYLHVNFLFYFYPWFLFSSVLPSMYLVKKHIIFNLGYLERWCLNFICLTDFFLQVHVWYAVVDVWSVQDFRFFFFLNTVK